MDFRIGEGWDIHALVPGRRLVLGGVEIAHSAGLLGQRYLAAVHAGLEQYSLVSHQAIPLHFTQLGADSGLIGAGLLASELADWVSHVRRGL